MRVGLREIVFMIVLLAVPVASYFYVFKPRNEEIRQAEKEVEEKREKLQQLREIEKTIDDINRMIDEGKKQIDLIEAKLPSARDVDVVLRDITQLARKTRLKVNKFKTERQIPAASYMEQPITVNIEGEFEGFYDFLREVEALPRITRVHTLTLKRAQGREARSKAQMTATFTLSVYFQGSGKQLAGMAG